MEWFRVKLGKVSPPGCAGNLSHDQFRAKHSFLGFVELFFLCFATKFETMDVAEQVVGTNIVKDVVGERCQKLFQDFLEE